MTNMINSGHKSGGFVNNELLFSSVTSCWSWTVKPLFLSLRVFLWCSCHFSSELPSGHCAPRNLFYSRLSVSSRVQMLCIDATQFLRLYFKQYLEFQENFFFKADMFLVMTKGAFEMCFAVIAAELGGFAWKITRVARAISGWSHSFLHSLGDSVLLQTCHFSCFCFSWSLCQKALSYSEVSADRPLLRSSTALIGSILLWGCPCGCTYTHIYLILVWGAVVNQASY